MKKPLAMYLDIAQKHADRIVQARKQLATIFPLTPETMRTLSDTHMLWIELLVNRFSKLQDVIGSRLLDFALLIFDDTPPINQLTMKDKLNQLEKHQVIESADL